MGENLYGHYTSKGYSKVTGAQLHTMVPTTTRSTVNKGDKWLHFLLTMRRLVPQESQQATSFPCSKASGGFYRSFHPLWRRIIFSPTKVTKLLRISKRTDYRIKAIPSVKWKHSGRTATFRGVSVPCCSEIPATADHLNKEQHYCALLM